MNANILICDIYVLVLYNNYLCYIVINGIYIHIYIYSVYNHIQCSIIIIYSNLYIVSLSLHDRVPTGWRDYVLWV